MGLSFDARTSVHSGRSISESSAKVVVTFMAPWRGVLLGSLTMQTAWSKRSAVALVSIGWMVACGESFSSTGAASDGGADAAFEAGGPRFCDTVSGAVLCDDFDDRASGLDAWSTTVSGGGSVAIEGTDSFSAPHSLLARASSEQNAVVSYTLKPTQKIIVDVSIKVEKLAVGANTLVRFASLTTTDLEAVRLDFIKVAGGTYELRASVLNVVKQTVSLEKLAALESGWHRITWTTAGSSDSTTSEVKLDGETLGALKFADVPDGMKNGLRFHLGVVVPAGENVAEVRYDNVNVSLQ